MKVAVVMPVFNDWQAAERLLPTVRAALAGHDGHIFVIDDGSTQTCPWPASSADSSAPEAPISIVRLRRNVGHQRAIACGLCRVAEIADFDCTVVMDADGEDDPTHIAALLAATTPHRIAVAARSRRREHLWFRGFYVAYRVLFSLATGRRIDFGNFCALPRSALQRIIHMEESWLHFAAALIVSRVELTHVPLARAPRLAGQSSMNLSSLVTHGLRAMAVFTDTVLTRLVLVCSSLAFAAVMALATAVALKAIGRASPGWVTTIGFGALLATLQLGGVLLVGLFLTLQGNRPRRDTTIETARDLTADVVTRALPG